MSRLFRRLALVVGLVSLGAALSGVSLAVGSGASPLPSHRLTSAQMARDQRLADAVNPGGPIRRRGVLEGTNSVRTVSSGNWSGYADIPLRAGYIFRYSFSRFTVPSLNCTTTTASNNEVGIWVGIDGYSSDTVEQTGIAGGCIGGTPSYYAWYEMYPKPPVVISPAISAGDAIAVWVRSTGGQHFTVNLTDMTTGVVSQTSTLCGTSMQCKLGSTEAIVESPGTSSGLAALPDFEWVTMEANTTENNSNEYGGLVSSHWNTLEITKANGYEPGIEAEPYGSQVNGPLQGSTAFEDRYVRP